MSPNVKVSKGRMYAGGKPPLKRILFISNEGSITGAPLFLIKFLKYLKVERPGYNIAVFFAKKGELVDLSAKDGFKIFVSEKRGGSNSKSARILSRFVHYAIYLRILYSYRPNLVYSNTIVNFGEVIIASLFKVPVLLHIHEGEKFCNASRHRLRITCFFANRIIVGSNYVNSVLNALTRRFGIVVHNGVDSPAEMPVKRRLSDASLQVGVLGTIDSNKGQQVALEAIRLLVKRGLSAKLKIAGKVGDDEYYAELRNFVEQNSLNEFVEFVGVVPVSEAFLYSLDLLVVPSFDEAFPTVVLEAFSAGIPVVASNVGGIPEMIENKVNGFLFKAGDSIELSDILENIIYDSDVLVSIRRSAFKLLQDRFQIRNTNRLLVNNLDHMLM